MKRLGIILLGVLAVGLVVSQRGRILGERTGVELVAVGDVMLGRSVNTTMQRKDSFVYPFSRTARVLRRGDITFGNLESPLVSGCPWTDYGMIFCGDTEAVGGLEFAGFDVMSVANNHIFNYGSRGFEETVGILEESGIKSAGNGLVGVVEKEGLRLRFLGFDDVTKRIQVEQVEQVVQVAQEESDVVVVSVHWGTEYRSEPTLRQRELGRVMVDAGADLVLGHHPHWVQPVERYGEGVIAYSLGNFVFDQMWSEETRKGVVARFWITDNGVEGYELLPVKIYDYSQPRFE